MPFLFYIDNQLTDQPVNDTALVTSIKRDSQLSALLITQDVELIYNGNNALATGEVSGYSVLKNLFDNAICNEAEVEIYDQQSDTVTVLLYKGIIKIPQVSIQEQEVLLSCKVQDNSFYSYINNNREIKVNFLGNSTKSLEAITPLQWYSVDFYNSMNCLYGSVVGFFYQGYSVTDALEFIIAAISDNKIGFRSDYLSGLTEPLFIFKGQALLNPYTIYPTAPEPEVEISFSELFTELNKIYNLVFFIDSSDPNNPVLRIENYEFIYGTVINFAFEDIRQLKTSIDSQNLYSVVNVGSDVVVSGTLPEYTWNAATSYFGWKKEGFFPLGQCNTNQELNLESRFIIDSNAIQDTVALGSTSEIDSYFLIQCSNIDTVGLTADAHQFPYFGAGGCYFNLGINNFFKMQRASVLFETTFGNFLGIGSNGFRALLGDSPTQDIIFSTVPFGGYVFVPPGGVIIDPVEYVNETTGGGYDGGNNYDNTTFVYTAPLSGDYSFLSRFIIQIANMQGTATGFLDTFTVYNTINVYDSAMVFKFASTQIFTLAGVGANGTHTLDTTLVGILDATDIVSTSLRVVYNPNQSGNQQLPRFLLFANNSFFECNGTPDGGIAITSGNETVKKYLHEFEYNIPASDWQTIVANPSGMLSFEKDGVTRFGWIQEMQHNEWTGQTRIKLITNNATT